MKKEIKLIENVSDESIKLVGSDLKSYLIYGEDWETLEDLIIDRAITSLGEELYNYICEEQQVPDLTGELLWQLNSSLFYTLLQPLITEEEGERFRMSELPPVSKNEILTLESLVKSLEGRISILEYKMNLLSTL